MADIVVSKKHLFGIRTIQKAIEKASSGDKIIVQPGTYSEPLFIKKNVHIINDATQPGEVVIQTVDETCLRSSAHYATIEGITIRQKKKLMSKEENYDSAVVISDGTLIIEKCLITSKSTTAIFINHMNASLHIKKSEIFDTVGNGINIKKSKKVKIEECKFMKNKLPSIFVGDGSDPEIINCEFSENESVCLYIKGAKGTINKCNFSKNKDGSILLEDGANPLVLNCGIYHNQGHGISALKGSLGVFRNCDFYGHNELSAIVIEEGSDPKFYNCKIHDGESNSVVVKNNGKGLFEKCEMFANGKEGTPSIVIINHNSSPLFKECDIHHEKDVAVWFREKGYGAFENCNIFENEKGGIDLDEGSNPLFRFTHIFKNKRTGIAIFQSSFGKFESCEIYENEYSNVGIAQGSYPKFFDSKIYKSKKDGVRILEGSKGQFFRCDIYENEENGTLISEASTPQFTSCSIYRNKINGIEAIKHSQGSLIDCKVFDNVKEDTLKDEDSELTIQYRETQKNTTPVPQQEVLLSKETAPSNIKLTNELDALLKELDGYIGLESVKTAIRNMINRIEFIKLRRSQGVESLTVKPAHTVFYGKPGTGKTTIANLIARIYKAMGLIQKGEAIEVDRSQIVGEFIGQSEKLITEYIEKAKDGVLFIDEAYSLTPKDGKDRDFGAKIIDVLTRAMTKYEGKLIVIVAGYPDKMNEFLNSNEGLSSRFTQKIYFDDYTPTEMVQIAHKKAASENYIIHSETEKALLEEFIEIYRDRDENFGNARLVNNYVGGIIDAHATRCSQLPKEELNKTVITTLMPEDAVAYFNSNLPKTYDIPINEKLLKEQLEEINTLIGLKVVKKDVEEIVKLVRYYREEGIPLKNVLSPHTLLLGNPGTGKTEVARILGKIYEALGIMPKGKIIETNRDSFVGTVQGETEQKTKQILDQAKGRTLFIDEAYALSRGGNDIGQIAVESILKRMEDDKGQFVLVAAGYYDEMQTFLDSNTGLRSRFGRTLHFEDYNPDELVEITELRLKKMGGYILEQDAKIQLKSHFEFLYDNRDRKFSNARLARNIAESSIKKYDLRMAELPKGKRPSDKKITIDDLDLTIKG